MGFVTACLCQKECLCPDRGLREGGHLPIYRKLEEADILHGPLTWIDSCFGHQVDCICSIRPGEGASDSISLSGDTPHTQSGNRLVCSCGAGHTCWPGCFSFCLPTVLWEIDIRENLYIKDKNAKPLGLSGRIFLPRGGHQQQAGRPRSFLLCLCQQPTDSLIGLPIPRVSGNIIPYRSSTNQGFQYCSFYKHVCLIRPGPLAPLLRAAVPLPAHSQWRTHIPGQLV